MKNYSFCSKNLQQDQDKAYIAGSIVSNDIEKKGTQFVPGRAKLW